MSLEPSIAEAGWLNADGWLVADCWVADGWLLGADGWLVGAEGLLAADGGLAADGWVSVEGRCQSETKGGGEANLLVEELLVLVESNGREEVRYNRSEG